MNKPLLATYCTNKAIPMLTEEDIRLLDIVYIGFGRVDGTQVCLDELTNLKRMADIRRVNPGIRLILTTASGENGGFPAGTRTEADIRALAVNLAGAVKAYGFDGLDIDWEYPTVNGDPTERHRHTLLLKALREELDKLEGHRTLSIAAGCKTWYFQITELSESVAYLDYVNLMTYDINANNPYTMHHACAYPMATDRETEGSAAENIEVFHRHGVPLDKIIIGELKEVMAKYGVVHESWGPFAEGRKDFFTNPTLQAIGAKYGKSVAQTALRFLIQSDVVVIPKSTHKERMAENLDVFDFQLSQEDMVAIRALDDGQSAFFSHYDPATVEFLTSLGR